MIEFKCLIHKPTGYICRYDEFLRLIKEDKHMTIIISAILNSLKDKIAKEYTYCVKDILFNDEFEVVYNETFTESELARLCRLLPSCCDNELRDKISILFNQQLKSNSKYGRYGINN